MYEIEGKDRAGVACGVGGGNVGGGGGRLWWWRGVHIMLSAVCMYLH